MPTVDRTSDSEIGLTIEVRLEGLTLRAANVGRNDDRLVHRRHPARPIDGRRRAEDLAQRMIRQKGRELAGY